MKKLATELGVNMTEVIERKIGDMPLVDNRLKKEQFESVYNIYKEINYIGKNINQLIIAIQQIRSDKAFVMPASIPTILTLIISLPFL